MSDHPSPDIPLPSGWARSVKSAVLHFISLAHFAIAAVRGWAANSINARVGLAAENDRFKEEIDLLREELRIKNARIAKIDPRRRPHYPHDHAVFWCWRRTSGLCTRRAGRYQAGDLGRTRRKRA